MKLKQLLSFCLFAVHLASFAQSDAQWKTYAYEEGGFSIDMPGEPVYQQTSTDTELGELMLNIYIHQPAETANDPTLVYMVNVTDYPADFIEYDNKEFMDNFFKNSANGAATNVGGKLLSQEPLAFNGRPASLIRIDYLNGLAIIRMKMILKGDRIFVIQSITSPEDEGNDRVKRFYESFKLL